MTTRLPAGYRGPLAMRRLLLLALALCATGCSSGAEPPALRVVLVTVDTLRADAFGQGERPTAMPRTLARAASAARFDSAFAATGATQPSHASVFTGRHPWQHGLTRNGMVLAAEEETLAERLRDAGFATAAIVASYPLHPSFGFDQGFDLYDADFDLEFGIRQWEGAELSDRRFYRLAEGVTDAALGWLAEARGGKQFLWLHYFDPHGPYGDTGTRSLSLMQLKRRVADHPEETERLLARARRLYRADVTALDRSLERLFEALERDAATTETHVVLTADHGESFGEGGALGHGHRLHAPELHVPLLIWSPRIAPGARADVAGSIDLHATLLALAGVDPRSGGRDLREPAPGSRAFGMRRSYPEPYLDRRTDGTERLLTGPWFYAASANGIHTGDASIVLESEAAESPASGADAAALRETFAAFERELAGAVSEERLDAETREALEALGYVQ